MASGVFRGCLREEVIQAKAYLGGEIFEELCGFFINFQGYAVLVSIRAHIVASVLGV